MTNSKKISISNRNKLIAITVALLGVLVVWRVIQGPSAEDIKRATIHALENGDAHALYALADPEEIKITRLTPEKVRLLLRSTIWESGLPKQVRVGERLRGADDEGFWNVDWGNKRGKYKMVVLANDHPKNGWHLNLSWMLYSTCVWKNGDKGSDAYYAFARENGVTGFRHQSGVYNNPLYFADLGEVVPAPPRPL